MKFTIKLIATVIVILCTAGCTEKPEPKLKNVKYMQKPGVKISMKSTKVANIKPLYIVSMNTVGKYLVLIDKKADKVVKLYDTEKNMVVKAFGELGEGPVEFISPTAVIPDVMDKRAFWIYDMTKSKLKKFNIDNVLKDKYGPEKIIRISSTKCGFSKTVTLTDRQEILGVGFYTVGRIALYNKTGEFKKTIGNVPVDGGAINLTSNHSHGYVGDFVFVNKYKNVFIATRYGSILEKYSLNGDVTTYMGIDPFFPEYDIANARGSTTMMYNDKTRFGYLDVCYNKKTDRLYLLYSGKKQFINKRPSNAYLGNIIYEFDIKSEKLIKEIELDRKVWEICLSENGSKIFGLTDDDVYQFSLDE